MRLCERSSSANVDFESGRANRAYHCVQSVCIWTFFWSVFFRGETEYGEIQSISPYPVQTKENTDQKISEYGHFSRSILPSVKENISELNDEDVRTLSSTVLYFSKHNKDTTKASRLKSFTFYK